MSLNCENIVYYTNGTHESFPVNNGFCIPIELISTIGMLTIGKEAKIDDKYSLAEQLTAEVKLEDKNYVVVEYSTEEYGIGGTIAEAQQDLLNSMVEYLISLKQREDRLGLREKNNLKVLRSIIRED